MNKNKKIFLVDIDGTVADCPNKLTEVIPGYNPLEQLTYEISDEILKEFQKPEFYNELKYNLNVIEFLSREIKKSPNYKVVFLSKCLNEEVAEAKIKYLKNLVENDKIINYSFEDVQYGDAELTEIFRREKLLHSGEEIVFYCLDDNPSRLNNYMFAKKYGPYNLEIFPVEHIYNKNYIDSNKEYFSKILKWNGIFKKD